MSKSLNAKAWAMLVASGMISSATVYAAPAEAPAPLPQQSQQNTGTAIGTVTDSDGEPLIGATVKVEGTTNGAATNLDGEFSLSNVKHGAKITVNYIGYQPQSMTWTGQALNFILSSDESNLLDEVVVMGYGVTQKRAKVTNSVAKVSEKTLTVGANANPAQALAGAVSGVKVNVTSGDPSATPSIVIRGGTNWSGTSNPLVVVDGQIRSSLSDINPNDIADMQILKDAGATALYGARAANGVILVTTKQGKQGKSNVTFNGKVGINYNTLGYEMVSARDYLTYMRRGTWNTEWAHTYNKGAAINALSANNQPHGIGRTELTANTVWNIMTKTDANAYLLKQGWEEMVDPIDPNRTIIFRDTNISEINVNSPSVTQDYNLSFSGGNDRGSYYAGLGYYDAEGALVNTFYKRYSFSFSGGYKINNWLTSNSTFNYIRSNYNRLPNGFTDGGYGDGGTARQQYIFGRIMTVPRTIRLVDEEGNPVLGQNWENSNFNYQPDQFIREYQNDKFQMTQAFTANIIDGLTLKGTMSWMYNEDHNETMNKEYQTSIDAIAGSNNGWNKTYAQTASFSRYFDQTYNLVANYQKTFAEAHTVNAMVGVEFYERQYKAMSASGNSSPTGYWMDLGLTFAGTGNPYKASSRSVDSSHAKERILSYFARVEYDYMDKYLVAATFREDGYSRLVNNRWGAFPGVSAGWVFSKENFWTNNENLSFVNYGKVRASFGINGVVNTNTIGYYNLKGAYSAYNYNGNYGYRISSLPNPDLRWEKTRTAEVGLDLGFLQNRFNLGLTYYNRLTSDKYANYQLPVTTGFSSVVNNNGKFRNQGVEIDVEATLVNTRDFTWSLGANLTYNKNIVVELPENEYPQFNYQQNATAVYTGRENPAELQATQGKWELTYIGGLQEGQEPNHLIGYKKAYMVRSEKDIPANYIDVSNGNAAVYSDDAAYQRLVALGKADGAVKLMPGDVVWQDRNGDSTIDVYDQYDLGNRTPHWTGGFNTTFSWKGLSLYARFDMGFDFTVYDGGLAWQLGGGQGTYSFPKQIFDTWTEDNPGAKYPRFVWASVFGTNAWVRTSDVLAESGAYLACRELQLSYTLPAALTRKFACENLTVSVTGQNLGYIKKTTLPLPDNTTYTYGGASGWAGTYNLPRTLLFGLNVTF